MSPQETSRGRAFVAALSLLAVAACFLVVTGAKISSLWYLPGEHRWTFDKAPGTVGIDWYFRGGSSLAVGALAGFAGRALVRRSVWARRASSVRLVFGLAFGVMCWAALYMVFALVTTPRLRHVDVDVDVDEDAPTSSSSSSSQ